MNYNEALSHIKSLEKFGSKPGLERISSLCNALGNPQKKLKFIHVAGTNGKGSTCKFIANILAEMGFKVGIFSSPAIRDFKEYIHIIGEGNIPEDNFARIAEKIISTKIFATEFEFTTAMAFEHFLVQQCNYVVLETGLGGLFDCTNIIPSPELAVITPISLDHTAILGSTIEEITAQKCGIIKQAPCVSANQPFMPANTIFAPIPQITAASLEGTHFSSHHGNHFIPLLGIHQPTNASLAITAVKTLFPNASLEIINKGLAKTYLPCRFEVVQKNPYIIYDGAHNPSGAEVLVESLKTYFPNKKITFVIGMLADKDHKSCIKILAPIASKFIVTTPHSPRALPAEILAASLREFSNNVQIDASKCPTHTSNQSTTSPQALCPNKSEQSPTNTNNLPNNDIVCVCGSFTLF